MYITIPVYVKASKLNTLAKLRLDKFLRRDSGSSTTTAIGIFTNALKTMLFK
jgi:hypothetical protein